MVAPPYSLEAVDAITLHSLKRKVPQWTAIAYPSSPTALVNTGAWAGSELAAMSEVEARRIASGLPTALHYASESVAESALSVAVCTASLVAAWVASLKGAPLPLGEEARKSLVAFRDRISSRPRRIVVGVLVPQAPAPPSVEPSAPALALPSLAPAPVSPPLGGDDEGDNWHVVGDSDLPAPGSSLDGLTQ